jgi:hypothetical protein
MRAITLWLLFLLFASGSSGQQPSAYMMLAGDSIKTGERITLTLGIEYRTDQGERNITWPDLSSLGNRSVEVLKKSPIDTIINSGGGDPMVWREEMVMQITSFDTGFIAISPLAFIFNEDTLETNPELLFVAEPLVNPEDTIRDIFDVEDVSIPWWKQWLAYWPYVLGALALLGILLVLWWRRKYRRNVESVPAEMPVIAPHVKALKELSELRSRGLWQNGRHKQYHTELNRIVRAYLFEQYGIQAMEETSTQVIRELRRLELPVDIRSRLEGVLKLNDLVKFAKERPLASENDEALNSAETFVRFTARNEGNEI